jgi:oligosaccharide repeat unit polymerase
MEREKNVESKMNIKRNILIFPLIMVQIYLVGVIFLYVLGPWEWPTHKPALFYLLIFLYQLFFGLGYLLSINKSKRSVRNLKPKSVDRFLAIMIIINFIYVIFNFLHTVGLNSFSISNIIDAFVNGILNPSVQYKMKFSADKFGGSYFTYFSVLMAPVMWSVFPLSIYNFKRLKLSYKLIVLISLFFELARWIATGTSKGIIDVILIILVVTVVKYMKKRALDNRNRIFDFKKYRFRILVLSLIVVGVFFFSNNVGDRVNQNWSNYIISNGNVNINVDAPLMCQVQISV